MRRVLSSRMVLLMICASALSACGKAEVKTGSLTQHFTMVDAEGRNFGVVELDPVNGGTIFDVQGRVVGRITPPAPTTVAAAVSSPTL